MALRPATIRLSPAAAGVISRPTTRRSAASALRLVPDGSCRRARKLRLCCAPEDDEWWATPVRPEDLVEPTGHGAEEVIAIRDALVGDPLRPVSLAFQEIVATGGNIFRCRCFHAGVMSGYRLNPLAWTKSCDITIAHLTTCGSCHQTILSTGTGAVTVDAL